MFCSGNMRKIFCHNKIFFILFVVKIIWYGFLKWFCQHFQDHKVRPTNHFVFLNLCLYLYDLSSSPPGGRVTPSMWRIRRCATGQGMVFDFSVLNRLYNCVRIWPNYKQDEICLYSYKTNDCNVNLLIVIREDWLWKTKNIKHKNNSATVYVGSSLKVHNPLFPVGKLRPNKLMKRFYCSVWSKWWECFWTLCTVRSTKTYSKGVWRVS